MPCAHPGARVQRPEIRGVGALDLPQQAAEDADHHGRFHADWLSFMLPRLEVARDLLREDGCIVISIDENELPNLWKLCEEVFGAENFVECMVYDKKSSAKGVPPAQMIAAGPH